MIAAEQQIGHLVRVSNAINCLTALGRNLTEPDSNMVAYVTRDIWHRTHSNRELKINRSESQLCNDHRVAHRLQELDTLGMTIVSSLTKSIRVSREWVRDWDQQSHTVNAAAFRSTTERVTIICEWI